MDPELKRILDKYKFKLERDMSNFEKNKGILSQEYNLFKQELLSREVSFFEKLCNAFSWLNIIKPTVEAEEKLRESIKVTKLNITTGQVSNFAFFVLMICLFLAIFSGVGSFLFLEKINFLLIILFILIGLVLFIVINNYPNYLANKWRLKASNQMVICILYVVMYMRHTSNLEHAIRFAANHIGKPLSLDLRKVFWDVETGKYSTITESLDNYLSIWKKWNSEFVESFSLVESSLYEPVESKRIELLDRALQVMLDGTYEKMMHFAHELKNPITMLHMLGIVLPILGLVIFPLVASFLGGLVKWYHLAIAYNILLPIFVFYLGNLILSKRPTGYGETDITEQSTELKKFKNIAFNFLGKEVLINPFYIAAFVGLIILIIGLSPVILHLVNPDLFDSFFDYRCDETGCNGPHSILAVVLGLFLPLSLAFGVGTYYKLRSKKPYLIRENTKKLEKEFSSSLFQLGNRVGDGIPVELAFSRVAENMKGTASGEFFRMVDVNIRQRGLDVERAIFDPKIGAINFFPSDVIESSMEVLVETSRKSPSIVARAMTNIANYINSIHKVTERLKDLLADILASMKSQIMFLTPAIAGIVVAIASMVVNIIDKLGKALAERAAETGEFTFGGLDVGLFEIQNVIPSYFFQLVVGIYVVQVVILLTVLSSRIENGEDKLSMENSLGKNLFKSTLLYSLIGLAGILLFRGLSGAVVGGFGE